MRCEHAWASALTRPTGAHGDAVADDVATRSEVDGFIARIDSGEVD